MRGFAILLLAVAFAAGPAQAQPGHKADQGAPPGKVPDKSLEKAIDKAVGPGGEGRGQPADGGDMAGEVAETIFTEVERRLIRDYYGDAAASGDGGPGKAKQMPPGLARRDQLPPGLQRHIEKYGTLPPGLEGRALPDDLLGRLPKRKAGYDRRILGDDVVLIERATGAVLDILEDVVRAQ